jgi:hypothetical protein
MLREQKQLVVQHDESDIDYVDNQRDQVGDDAPNEGWSIYGAFFDCINDELMSVLLEELE